MKNISILITFLFIGILSFGQSTIWSEDFSDINDDGIGAIGPIPTITAPISGKWSIDVSNCSLVDVDDYFKVHSGKLEARDVVGTQIANGGGAGAIWTSENINIIGKNNVIISIDISHVGDLEDKDFAKVSYQIDGGTITPFGFVYGNFADVTYTVGRLTGSTLKIYLEADNTADTEKIRFDNITVVEGSSMDDESVISIANFTYPTNIEYTLTPATYGLTDANSLEVAKFIIIDGNGISADTDSKSTILTSLSIDINNYTSIKAIALFDGSTNLAEVTTPATTVDFNGLSIKALDNSTKEFSVRVSFTNTQIDNYNLQFTISSAVASFFGSTFSASNAGGASSDISGDNNKINVIATKLNFTINKPSSLIKINDNSKVEVEAIDANNNRDLSATNSINLSKASGTLGTLSSTIGLTQSLSSGVYLWTDIQYNYEEDFTIITQDQTASLSSKTTGIITCVTPINPTLKGDLILSEIVGDGADGNISNQNGYVEIYNNTNSAIELTNVTVRYYNENSINNATSTVQLSGLIASHGYVIVTRNINNFNLYYAPITADFFGATFYFNGDDDGVDIIYDDKTKASTIIDEFNYNGLGNSPFTWSQSNVFERISTRGDGAELDSWFENILGQGSPKDVNEKIILPIDLIYFSAKADNNNNIVNLKWKTASEINNDYFTIERSNNAIDFVELTKIQSAGNSNKITFYEYSDLNRNMNNIVYYRLKQTDFDGEFTISEIISVNSNSDKFDILNSYGYDGDIYINMYSYISISALIEVFDISGRVVFYTDKNLEEGIITYKINMPNYASGLYFIRIASEKYKQSINAKLVLK